MGRAEGARHGRMNVPVFVVDLVAVAGGVNDVEAELHAVLDNDCEQYL